MQESLRSYSGVASVLLFAASTFVACGGLDQRKVTREPGEATAGSESSAGDGPGPSSGGSDAQGGGPGNPFGGQLFEGGAPPVVDGPPEVLEVDPVDTAADVEPGGAVSLLFSEGLDEATVTAENVKILDGDVEVAGELSYSGVVASFEPTRRLSLLASYDVSVSTGVTDIGGTALAQAFASRFTVRDGIWREEDPAFEPPAQGGFGYQEQDVGIDARGNTLVVFTRYEDPFVRVVGRWYRATSGWQAEVMLDDGTRNATAPSVAVSPEGDAAVAWFGNDVNGDYRVLSRRYVNGAWEDSQKDVTNLATDVFKDRGDLRVAIGGGQAVVTWIRLEYVPNPSSYYIYLNLSAAPLDAGWPDYPTQNFSTYYVSPNYDWLQAPAPTLDANGNAVVAFAYTSNYVDPNPNYGPGVYYTRKATNGTWQYPAKIPSSPRPDYGPYLATDGDGAMAVWVTSDTMTGQYRILGSRYTKAKQFVAGVDIGDPDLTGYVYMSPKSLAGNATGFFSTWTQTVGSSRNAYVNHFDLSTGEWDELPTVVSDAAAYAGSSSSVGVDEHGHALVTFEQEAANFNYAIMFARRPAGGEWSAPDVLTPDDDSYQSPLLTVASNGIAGLLFQRGRQGPIGGNQVGGQFQFFD